MGAMAMGKSLYFVTSMLLCAPLHGLKFVLSPLFFCNIDADIKATRTRLTKIFGSLKACVEAGVITDIVTKDPFIKALMLRLGFTKPHRNSGDGLTQHAPHGRSASSKRKKPRVDVARSTEAELLAEADDLAVLDAIMASAPDSNDEGARAVEDADLKQFHSYCTLVRAKIMACLPDGALVPTGRALYDLGWYFPLEIRRVVHVYNSEAYTAAAAKILNELHPEKTRPECKRGLLRGCAFGIYSAAVKAYRSRAHSGNLYSKLVPDMPGRENEIPQLVMDAIRTGQKCMSGHIEEFSEAVAAGTQCDLEVAVAGFATVCVLYVWSSSHREGTAMSNTTNMMY